MSLSEGFKNMRINSGRRRSPLSNDNLSDPGATPARKLSERNPKNDQARFLIKAFKDFILPIVHAQESGSAANREKSANDNFDRAGLGPAAQQLVNALENFITSLISTEVVHVDGAQSKEASDIRDNTGLIMYRTPPGSLIFGSKAPKRPRLLTLALDEARDIVFNKMPIRLLTFNPDGSGINLLDRNTTWDYVSTVIEAGFNEDEMNKDIDRRNYPVHRPGVEKEAIEHYLLPYMRYAILSHTWLHDKPGEVTYDNWKDGKLDTDSPGYRKLSNFCRIAATDYGIALAWMDTICINKDSSAELDESIRSMYNWYWNASVCITYLAQTTILTNMDNDAWFTRGWTLQELLAPRYNKFYGADWKKLNSNLENDKENYLIQKKISAATSITSVEFNNPDIARVSRKMQWAANRRVTREEDIAYSLMGIFNVSLSIAYGEGAGRAFFRLTQQILNSKGAGIDIINWGYGPGPDPLHLSAVDDTRRLSSLIPSHPQQYLWRAETSFLWGIPSIPVTLTHLGLHLSVLLMPAISANDSNLYPFHPIGDYYGTVTLDAAISSLDGAFFPAGQTYNVLDRAIWHNTGSNVTSYRHQITFAVLNFMTTKSLVSIPISNSATCFAVALYFNNSYHPSLAEAEARKDVKVIPTRTAITFDLLHSHRPMIGPSSVTWLYLPKKDLAKHGMQLLDMYI